MRLTEVYFAQVKRYRNMEPLFLFDFTPELKVLAFDDAKCIMQSLRLSKRRKAVLEWAATGEVWWLLFHPNSIASFRLIH